MSIINKYLQNTPAPQIDAMENLIDLCNTISTEAFMVGNLGNYLNKRLAVLSASVQNAFRQALTRNFRTPEVLNVGPVARMLRSILYTELSERTAYTPVGFTGNFHDYVVELQKKRLSYLTGILTEVLIPAQKRFGHYLNNLADINERRSFEAGSKYSQQMLTEMKRDEAKWVIQGNHRDSALWGDLFTNNGEIVATFERLNQINQQHYKAAPPQAIEREVDRLMTITNALFNQLSGEAGTNASAQFVEMLAIEMQTVAQWVEWYSVMTVRLLDTTAAMKENEKLLMRV